MDLYGDLHSSPLIKPNRIVEYIMTVYFHKKISSKMFGRDLNTSLGKANTEYLPQLQIRN